MYKHMLFALLAINSNLALSGDESKGRSPSHSPEGSPKRFILPIETGEPKAPLIISPTRQLPRELDLCACLRSALPWLFMRVENLLNPDGRDPKKD